MKAWWRRIVGAAVIGGATATGAEPPTGGTGAPAAGGPLYFVAIHNEPFHDDGAGKRLPEAYAVLRRMVERADRYHMRLTIMFSPPWADFLLSDPDRKAVLEAWKKSGHEIAAHHHSIYHGNWDGYTAYPKEEALAERRRRRPVPETYQGTLDDYMAKVRRLHAGMRSGCLNDERDKKCLPDAILIDTGSGFANAGPPGMRLDDAEPGKGCNHYVSTGSVNGIERRWLCHYQTIAPDRVRLARQVFDAMTAGVYGSVNHSSLQEEDSFNAWLDFLHERDPGGARSRTVSEVVDRKLLPMKAIPPDRLLAPAPDAYGSLPADLQALIDRCNDLIRLGREAGRDVSRAVELDRASREAYASGEVEECRRLLREAVDLLQKKAP